MTEDDAQRCRPRDPVRFDPNEPDALELDDVSRPRVRERGLAKTLGMVPFEPEQVHRDRFLAPTHWSRGSLRFSRLVKTACIVPAAGGSVGSSGRSPGPSGGPLPRVRHRSRRGR